MITFNNLAVLYGSQVKYASAGRFHTRLLDVRRRVLGAEHPDVLFSMHSLADTYLREGKYSEGEALNEKLQEIQRRVLGETHPLSLLTQYQRGSLYRVREKYQQPDAIYARVLEIRRRVMGDKHPETVRAMIGLAINAMMQGRYEEAEPRAKASPDIGRVEFIVDGRVVHVDRRRPFAYPLNTARLANRGYKLQVHGIAGPGRYDVEGARVLVDNKTFALTSAGARPWMPAPSRIRLRVRPWGQKAAKMVFKVDGRRRSVDRRPPFLFSWGAKRAKPGKHVLAVVATSIDGRIATRRIPVVVQAPPKPTPRPKP